MEELLSRLRKFDALRDGDRSEQRDRIELATLDAEPPTYASDDLLRALPAFVPRVISKLGVSRLYEHQAKAIEAIARGDDVVIEAPTASGKTLSFTLPILGRLAKHDGHALLIHPMKALSNDQRRQLESIANVMPSHRPLESWIYDGDTDREHRELLRRHPPAILLTNPEMLHLSFLQWSEQWETFLRGIRFLVIDEIHEYRGFFGTNVAILIRRFLAKLATLEAHPQLVLASATCRNPEEHALRLTGRRCKHIRATDGARPRRHFAFVTPDIPDFHYHRVFQLRVVRAALACVAEGLSTIVFCPSRRFAEDAARDAKSQAMELRLDPEAIAPYRSGFTAELRREIEDGMRSGRFRAVFTTNALEIGIDIGQLDACVLAGFPDNVMSAWQRIGRTGRSFDRTAYVLFFALNNPFDRFFASNIATFVERPLDEILIGVGNEELMRKHLPCAMYEANGDLSARRPELGKEFVAFAEQALAGTRPASHRPNYMGLDIRGGSGGLFTLKYRDREIGEISEVHRFREAYMGGIYSHFGRVYRVDAYTAGEVILVDAEAYQRSEGIFYTTIQQGQMLSGLRFDGGLAVGCGKLRVYENFAGYRIIDTRSQEVVAEERTNQALTRDVRGFWFEFDDVSSVPTGRGIGDLFGVEQLLRIGAPFVIPCDRHDLGTTTSGGDRRGVFLYETVPGGIGIAEKALSVWPELLETGIHIAEDCDCRNACPRCIVPHRLPSGAPELNKLRAITLAREILDMARHGATERYDPELNVWAPIGGSAR